MAIGRQAIDELRMATEIQYRGVTVQVVGRKRDSVQLKAGNGERKSLSTLQVRCDPDLAVALVLYRHRANPHVAWRMIGTFLSVDKFGDIELAQQYWRDAERNGIVVAPDRRAFTFLAQVAGANVQTFGDETSANDSGAAEDANVVDDTVLSASAEPRRPVPGKNALRAARRRATKDLESFFANKTEQGKEILVEELLGRATKPRLNPISAFALLDLAKQVGTELERGDIVLRSLVQMARSYDLDLKKAVSTELSSFEKSGATQEIVASAVQLGDEMIRAGEFRIADQLLASAESRLNAAPELTADVAQFRERLSQSKEINRAGVRALQTLSQDHKDADANRAAGLHYLIRHQFEEGLTHLLLSGHAELQNLAMADLTAVETSRPNVTLAAQWEILADEFKGVVKASMLARAKYWSGR